MKDLGFVCLCPRVTQGQSSLYRCAGAQLGGLTLAGSSSRKLPTPYHGPRGSVQGSSSSDLGTLGSLDDLVSFSASERAGSPGKCHRFTQHVHIANETIGDS